MKRMWSRSVVVLLGCATGLTMGCQNDETAVEPAVSMPKDEEEASAQRPPPLSDTDIAAAVRSSLKRDPGVQDAEIEIACTDGVVELKGTATDLLTKRRAVRVAERVKGVRAVTDRVVLNIDERPDQELELQVDNALLFNSSADSYEVDAVADQGVVTLTGNVQSYQEFEMAERLAEGVQGVREVENEISIEYGASREDSEVEADVKSRLRWDALVNDGLIAVAVDHGKVTLDGVVASAAERRRAFSDAWVDGVSEVDNTALEVTWWARERDLTQNKFLKLSDSDVHGAIRDAMAYDPRVSTADLRVAVKEGVATLSGRVDSAQARWAAQDVAKHTVGVVSVENDLAIVPIKSLADDVLRERVETALTWNPYTDAFRITVAVSDGKVTLGGRVSTAFDRAEATQIAADIRGVKDVDNNLAVDRAEIGYVYSPYLRPYAPYWESWHYPPLSSDENDADMATAIENELSWSPFVNAYQVKVSVTNGIATLKGTVDSSRERTAAIDSAYEAGALKVEGDQLKVAQPDMGE